MKKRFVMSCVGGLVLALGPAAMAVNMQYVTIGDPGNAPDDTGYGRVDYEYNIGTCEVTNAQYTEFLNAVARADTYELYSILMWSDTSGCKIARNGSSGSYSYSVDADRANRPVNHVSWGDAARFANWLHKGQPTGAQDLTTTEDGSYYLNGAVTNAALMAVTREADWKWAIPSEDEWYKAAYHKNDGVTGNYFDYPTSSDGTPSNDLVEPDPGNNANFYETDYTIGSPYYQTEVGEFENSESPYGTFDQGGNIFEWNEGIVSVSYRGVRGGSFVTPGDDALRAEDRRMGSPTYQNNHIGFRVVEVPEPASAALLLIGLPWLIRRRSRR